MVKKFFAAMIVAFALVVAGQTSTAEAGEVYVGTYSDGTAVYLLTETIQPLSRGDFSCKVRAGRDYLTYRFGLRSGSWYYTNSEGYEGWVYDGSSPVAANICDRVLGR